MERTSTATRCRASRVLTSTATSRRATSHSPTTRTAAAPPTRRRAPLPSAAVPRPSIAASPCSSASPSAARFLVERLPAAMESRPRRANLPRAHHRGRVDTGAGHGYVCGKSTRHVDAPERACTQAHTKAPPFIAPILSSRLRQDARRRLPPGCPWRRRPSSACPGARPSCGASPRGSEATALQPTLRGHWNCGPKTILHLRGDRCERRRAGANL